MKIGVRVHDFGKSDAKTLAKKAREVGFDGVQLVLNKAIEGESGLAGTLSKEKAIGFYNDFKAEGLDIFMLGAYFNPVHSDKNKVVSCRALVIQYKRKIPGLSPKGDNKHETGTYRQESS